MDNEYVVTFTVSVSGEERAVTLENFIRTWTQGYFKDAEIVSRVEPLVSYLRTEEADNGSNS